MSDEGALVGGNEFGQQLQRARQKLPYDRPLDRALSRDTRDPGSVRKY
jgi:hypothetical protein